MDLSKYQEKIKETYLKKDRERGLYKTFLWFIEEIGELAKAIRSGKNIDAEFADVLAWLLSVANLAGIDLDKAMRRYRQGCPKCKKLPCHCTEDKWPESIK